MTMACVIEMDADPWKRLGIGQTLRARWFRPRFDFHCFPVDSTLHKAQGTRGFGLGLLQRWRRVLKSESHGKACGSRDASIIE